MNKSQESNFDFDFSPNAKRIIQDANENETSVKEN